VKCKHLLRDVYFLGRARNQEQILWCRNCGSAKFVKGLVGPVGGKAKWYRMKSPPKAPA
jgi:hypothetical protein